MRIFNAHRVTPMNYSVRVMKLIALLSAVRMRTVFIALVLCSTHSNAQELVIAAANSTCNAIRILGNEFMQDYGQDHLEIVYICKSSGRLAKGLQGKAITADVYISANSAWMNYMVEKGLVDLRNISAPWSNLLVVASSSESDMELESLDDLQSSKVREVLIGDPSTAPFGRYSKEALAQIGIWSQIRPKIVTQKNISLLSARLADSSSDTVGILFKSNVTERHRILFTIDPSLHSPVIYNVATVENSGERPLTQAFISFIHSDKGKTIFKQQGFDVRDE